MDFPGIDINVVCTHTMGAMEERRKGGPLRLSLPLLSLETIFMPPPATPTSFINISSRIGEKIRPSPPLSQNQK